MDAKVRPWRVALSIVSAILMTLAQPPWSVGWLGLVALVPLLVAVRGLSLPRRILLGWVCGTFWSFAFVGRWLLPAAQSALGTGFLASFAVALGATQMYGGLHIALFAGLVGADTGVRWRDHAAVAAVWVATEALRSATFGGIPWGLLGHSLWLYPLLIQGASVFGVAAISFWMAFVNAALATALERRQAGQTYAGPVGLAVSVVALVAGAGAMRMAVPSGASVRVQVVHSDWNSIGAESGEELFARMLELSLTDAGEAEFTVWPEASFRFLPSRHPKMARKLFLLTEELDRDLIYGGPRFADGRVYNSVYRLSPREPELVASVDKRRLVPLAETPWRGLPSGRQTFASGAEDRRGLSAGSLQKVAVLLCFEALFPELALPADGDEPRLLINPTNDVRVRVGADQQAAMAVFRAVENGVPLLRVANRGPSLLVDSVGRVLERATGWGSAVWEVPTTLDSTMFRAIAALSPWCQLAGDGLLSLCCLVFAVASSLRRAL